MAQSKEDYLLIWPKLICRIILTTPSSLLLLPLMSSVLQFQRAWWSGLRIGNLFLNLYTWLMTEEPESKFVINHCYERMNYFDDFWPQFETLDFISLEAVYVEDQSFTVVVRNQYMCPDRGVCPGESPKWSTTVEWHNVRQGDTKEELMHVVHEVWSKGTCLKLLF